MRPNWPAPRTKLTPPCWRNPIYFPAPLTLESPNVSHRSILLFNSYFMQLLFFMQNGSCAHVCQQIGTDTDLDLANTALWCLQGTTLGFIQSDEKNFENSEFGGCGCLVKQLANWQWFAKAWSVHLILNPFTSSQCNIKLWWSTQKRDICKWNHPPQGRIQKSNEAKKLRYIWRKRKCLSSFIFIAGIGWEQA